MSTLDAELNDFGAQLAMLRGMASPVLRLSGWTVIGSDGTPLRS
jgi:hypothetical protein